MKTYLVRRHLFGWRFRPINAHQSGGDLLQNFSIVESPDPFGAGAYNFQSISAVRRNRVWLRETSYVFYYLFINLLYSMHTYRT